MEYVADQHFFPNNDINLPPNTFPRFRSFLLLDLTGQILEDVSGLLNPLYYPINPEVNYQATALRSII